MAAASGGSVSFYTCPSSSIIGAGIRLSIHLLHLESLLLQQHLELEL